MTYLILVLFLVILFLYIVEFFLNKIYFNSAYLKSIISFKKQINLKFPFDNNDNRSLIYIPSPHTNWTLNPFYRNHKDKFQHYREGFRKTCSSKFLSDKIKNNKKKIIFLGSSTTYCTDIVDYCNTWPALVQDKFSDQIDILNFGVPHFTLSQTLTRFVNWVNLIKPDLVFLYQAKNDLNYISNIKDEESYLNFDYENIQSQYGSSLSQMLPNRYELPFVNFYKIRKLKNLNFNILYKTNVDVSRLEKNDINQYKNTIILKTLSIANICNYLGVKFIYIPEIITGGIHKKILEENIYPELMNKINNMPNAEYYEIKNIIPLSNNYFYDKMHFNKEGCKIFSDIIISKINKIYG